MKRSKKGFTLMEMLIVVAIIAILVAIAIPTFSNALYKAKVSADKANVRALYSEDSVKYLLDDTAPKALTAATSISVSGNSMTLQVGKITVAADDATKPTKWTYTYTPDKATDKITSLVLVLEA